MTVSELFPPTDTFARRHLGSNPATRDAMLKELDLGSMDELIAEAIPDSIRLKGRLDLPAARSESALLEQIAGIAAQNSVFKSMIGMGYYDCITPPVIQRNILENPGWYTQYTPYQAEISQGRLEALINFQSMVADLTALPLSNASLLDEATAAAEAMGLCHAAGRRKKHTFYAAPDCHPQTLAVLQTRAEPIGIKIEIGEPESWSFEDSDLFGVLLQYPGTDGHVKDYRALCERARKAGVMVVMACDLLALTVLRPPGEVGADVAVGSTQRFGVPLGFGGPHAAFLSTTEKYKRQVPGRIIGVSKDVHGNIAYRLALQTREQHIRRDRATSNICTAQVLLAIMAGMYAVYHGPDGLRAIAERVRHMAYTLREGLRQLGFEGTGGTLFDTFRVVVDPPRRAAIESALQEARINVRRYDDGLGIALDERTSAEDLQRVLECFATGSKAPDLAALAENVDLALPEGVRRESAYLEHPVFHSYRTEHEMLRYLHRLQAKDLSLTTSMIPLGSCTMKLNATTEMLPVTWPEFGGLHPFAPAEQTRGYQELCAQLEKWLAEITGLSAVSLMPNSGAQGELAGLLVIRAYQRARGQGHRNVCLIPVSAHGTNPASAVMAGFRVVAVHCDSAGNIDIEDLKAKASEHADSLAAIMITYPSTHGVFESGIREICSVVHECGGQVYVDGANMNAQVGLCRPGDYGADVIHLNLHKTFCIPHGGGGPGMGPIACAEQLAPFLPGHPLAEGEERDTAIGPISAAPFGSPSILPISWMYIGLMGAEGLRQATEIAILNANYMASRLASHYDILYTGEGGRVAHEFILDLRPFKKSAGIEVDDVAKRLMDFGFHAPTMSFPVAGTLMVEPTESESRDELDRFCDTMIAIRAEIRAIEEGRMDPKNNALKNAPHTALDTSSDGWDRPYSREEGAFPAAWLRHHKYWPPVARVDNAYGDRNLMCTCPSVEDVEKGTPSPEKEAGSSARQRSTPSP